LEKSGLVRPIIVVANLVGNVLAGANGVPRDCVSFGKLILIAQRQRVVAMFDSAVNLIQDDSLG